MRKILVLGLVLVSGFCNAQSKLSVQNFLAFSIIKISDLDNYMNKNGFEMIDSEKKESSINLSYRTVKVNKDDIGMINVRKDLQSDSLLTYSFYNIQENERLLNDLHRLNFNLVESDNKEGVLSRHYTKEDCFISVYKMFDRETADYMYMYSFSVKRDK